MKKLSLLSTKTILILLCILFLICSFSIFTGIWNLSSLIFTKKTSEYFSSVPVLMSFNNSAVIYDITKTSYINNGIGSLTLKSSSFNLELYFSVYKLVLNIGILLSLFLMIKIVRSVLQGNPFHKSNGNRLKIISGIAILVPLLLQFSADIVINNAIKGLAFANITLHSEILGRSTLIVCIFSGILLFVISEVFRVGSSLKEETDLTV